MIIHGRSIHPGYIEGIALVTHMKISFYGGIDPENGMVLENGHSLFGQSIAGKILIFPTGKGSTVGSYTLYRLSKNGAAPLAIINSECEPITAIGCILGNIPCMDQVSLDRFCTGMKLKVDTNQAIIHMLEEIF